MILTQNQINDILRFWYPNEKYNKFWFDKNINIDKYIFENYNDLLFRVYNNLKNNIDIDVDDYNDMLSSVILLDQFSRNISRYTDEVNIISDISIVLNDMTEIAKQISNIWLETYFNKDNPLNHIVFILMPFRHTNKISEYKIVLNILEEINDKNSELYHKFKSHTLKRYNLLI